VTAFRGCDAVINCAGPFTPSGHAPLRRISCPASWCSPSLRITLATVKADIADLMTKLTARNRVELIIWAYQTGRVLR
jgi:hypothetical protein